MGFTSQILYFMQLSDFLIGKPGPSSISEAVQQRYNTDWVREHGAGIVLESFKCIRDGAMEIIHRIDEFRASIAHIRNRAVFEIPEILERIMESAQAHEQPRHGRDRRSGSVLLN